MTRPETSGYIPFSIPGISTPASTWYKVVGDLNTQPALIALHGGPGAGHSYLSPLIDLYNTHGIPIVFYDQVGCGNSTHFRDRMGDSEFWTINLFIRELNNLVDSLRLRERGFSILGSSWGGLLAGAYSITQPAGLKKTVIASGPSDISLYAEGARELLRQLPDKVRKTIEECEKKGDFESPEYEAASAVFTKRHVCRLDPFPQDLMDTLANLKDDPTVYMTMQGPSEFHISGSLKTWEGWSRAHLIKVPVLLTNGRYDEVQDISVKPWFKNIAKVRWVTFENSSHMAFWEERERYIDIVGGFLID